jgi:malate dehydrogenase (oxaloacetate-decarboxylating)(NADP+)
MKMAAAHAIAKLAREPVPAEILEIYNLPSLEFGNNYIIPTPFDPRLIKIVPKAVAQAAIESGVATKIITDWDQYEKELLARVGHESA